MTLEGKKKLLLIKNACFSCFKPNHIASTCRIKNALRVKTFHHFLMCPVDNIENPIDGNKN